MKKYLSPTVIIGFSTLVIIGVVVFIFILPTLQRINTQRQSIDRERALIASLQAQQSNIETVSNNYSKLAEQDTQVGAGFLKNETLVDFYDQLDALSDQMNMKNFKKQLDSPVLQLTDQALNLQLSFRAPYASALQFINQLSMLGVLVRPVSLNFSQVQGSDEIEVQIGSLVAWEGV